MIHNMISFVIYEISNNFWFRLIIHFLIIHKEVAIFQSAPPCSRFFLNLQDGKKYEKTNCEIQSYDKWYFVTKIVLTYCEKNCSSDRKKTFEITRTIY